MKGWPAILPVIAVTAKSQPVDRVSETERNYLAALDDAGASPGLLRADTPSATTTPHLQGIQGLLLSGGGDLHPRRYDQPVDGTEVSGIDEARDHMELSLTRAALLADLPILAICRGIQVLNVALGGGLIQHVDGHRGEGTSKDIWHEVAIEPHGLLAHILDGFSTLRCNSSHHQAVSEERLAPSLQVAACSRTEPPLVEAMQSHAHTWVLGVQWHPERAVAAEPLHQKLFLAFVAAAAAWQCQRAGAVDWITPAEQSAGK